MRVSRTGLTISLLLLLVSCSSLKREGKRPSFFECYTTPPQWIENLKSEWEYGNCNSPPYSNCESEDRGYDEFSEEYSFARLKENGKNIKNFIEPLNSNEPIDKEFDDEPGSSHNSSPEKYVESERATVKSLSTLQPLSRIEQLYNDADGMSYGQGIEQFGYSIFRNRSVENFEKGPIDPNYLLGPEDEVVIQTSGSIAIDQTLKIDRNGMLYIPTIGTLPLAGLPAGELHQIISQFISTQYKEFTLQASLGKLHSIRVMITGHVHSPGMKVIPANTTLIDLLYLSEGVTKEGSLRNVIVRRQGEVAQTIDLYSLLLNGNFSADMVLLSGDVISVEPIGATALIMGPFGNAIFETKGPTTLNDLAGYLGGVNAFTFLETVLMQSSKEQRRREVKSINFRSSGNTTYVNDGDIFAFLKIQGDINNSVTISGAVARPGIYPYKENMMLSDLIKLSEGFLLEAHLESALLQKPVGKKACYDQVLGDRQIEIDNEIQWIDLGTILRGNHNADMPIAPLDHLKILTKEEVCQSPTVSLIGAVRKPGRYRITANMTLHDLLLLAGGATPDAYGGTSTIVRRSYDRDKKHYGVKLIPFELSEAIEGGRSGRIRINNLDQIVVKKIQTLHVTATIDGHVQFPGTYVLPENSRISDLIAIAGGILEGAELRAAVFRRERVKELQQARIEHLLTVSEENFSYTRDYVTREGTVNEGVASHLRLMGLKNIKEHMMRFQTQGRVVVDFMNPFFLSSDDNLKLENNDSLTIPERMHSVLVAGQVFSPNAFVWQQGMRVSDYLKKSGGYREIANPCQVYVMLANGEVRSTAQVGYNRLMAMHLGPGDAIMVPPKQLGRSRKMMIWDSLSMLRELVEIGLTGAVIPKATERTANIGIELRQDYDSVNIDNSNILHTIFP